MSTNAKYSEGALWLMAAWSWVCGFAAGLLTR